MESKDLLDLCQKANIDVKNQLSSLDPDQRDLLVELVHKGASATPSAPAKPPTPASLPKPTAPVPTLKGRPVATHEAPPVPPIPPVPRLHVPVTLHEPPPIPPAPRPLAPPVPVAPAAEAPAPPPIPSSPVPEVPMAKTPLPPLEAPAEPSA